jgi:hypothetical protein
MKAKFDQMAKEMAQSVTRRGALKKFGVGLAGIALASFGLANTAEAGTPCENKCARDCTKHSHKGSPGWEYCYYICALDCPSSGGGV